MRPDRLYRASWAESAPARPLTQAQVADPELTLALHGAGSAQLKKSHHDDVPDDPWYVWSGTCDEPWALTLRHRRWLVDARGAARVVLRARQSGHARLRVVLGLERGDWLVSEESIGASAAWCDHELELARLTWRALDVARVAWGARVAAPDLGRVDAIGCCDLFEPRGADSCARVDFIDVFAPALVRDARAVPA